jgi:hypothetical protein
MLPAGAFPSEYVLPHRCGLEEQRLEALSETLHRLFSLVGKSIIFHEERASFRAVPLRGGTIKRSAMEAIPSLH